MSIRDQKEKWIGLSCLWSHSKQVSNIIHSEMNLSDMSVYHESGSVRHSTYPVHYIVLWNEFKSSISIQLRELNTASSFSTLFAYWATYTRLWTSYAVKTLNYLIPYESSINTILRNERLTTNGLMVFVSQYKQLPTHIIKWTLNYQLSSMQ